eukprot:16828-Heterococcus_DN1.PRE.2
MLLQLKCQATVSWGSCNPAGGLLSSSSFKAVASAAAQQCASAATSKENGCYVAMYSPPLFISLSGLALITHVELYHSYWSTFLAIVHDCVQTLASHSLAPISYMYC